MGLAVAGSPGACRSCRTRDCCYDRDVVISPDEVVTLARTLAVAPERFATLVPADGLQSSLRDPSEGRGRAEISLGGGVAEQRRMILRRRPDGAGRTRCVFLVTSGAGRPVCGAGALAPDACKAFPGPAVAAGASRVAGCWRTWEPHEVSATAPEADVPTDPAVVRWNERVAERRFPLPEAAFLHALLADPEVGSDPVTRTQVHATQPATDVLPEPASQSGCATCTTSRCCVMFDPELTGADLVRLIDGVGLEARDIAQLKATRKDQAGPDAIHLGSDCAWDLRLRRTAALAGHRGPGGARRCGFLMDLTHPDLAPASRCGVYAHRPLVCRLFPSDLTSFGVMVGTPEAVCPPQAWSQERADLPTLHTLHLVARRERERFRTFLTVWNPASKALAEAPRKDGEASTERSHDASAAAFMAALIAFERSVREHPDVELATLAEACVPAWAQPSK